MENENVQYLIKGTTSIRETVPYSVWFTVEKKSTGRVRVQFVDETVRQIIQPYMLIHLVSQTLKLLSINLPLGLKEAKFHLKKGTHADRFFEVKGAWYRIDNRVNAYWLNNSALLSMVKYLREMPESKVRDNVFARDKKMYRILNEKYAPNWSISFHKLAN